MKFADSPASKYAPGSVRELIVISLPIIVSQASESLMMLTDRFFLTDLGKEYPAASMSGGLTAFMAAIFFMGLMTYITPLVAQFLGAHQKEKCAVVVMQGIFLALALYPVIALLGYFLAPEYFRLIAMPEAERELALKYFNFLNFGVFLLLINVAFAGFFSGIGRTRVVMIVNLASMAANVPFAYYFIHNGIFGHFAGIEGAAIGTTLSKLLATSIYTFLFTRKDVVKEYGIGKALRFDADILKKLLLFGAPTGLEFFLMFSAFNTFVTMFHSYGPNEALAMTISFNWDLLAHMPIWGLNVGIMSLVGRYMGARQVDLALKTTYSGLKIAMVINVVFSALFWLYTEPLIMAFMPKTGIKDISVILQLAEFMLRWVCVYMFANSVNMVFTATLRAAGDTKWCMYGSICGQWTMLALSYGAIKVWQQTPQTAWTIFVCTLLCLSGLFTMRFLQGRWKEIEVVGVAENVAKEA